MFCNRHATVKTSHSLPKRKLTGVKKKGEKLNIPLPMPILFNTPKESWFIYRSTFFVEHCIKESKQLPGMGTVPGFNR
jgi:hypothetical protein